MINRKREKRIIETPKARELGKDATDKRRETHGWREHTQMETRKKGPSGGTANEVGGFGASPAMRRGGVGGRPEQTDTQKAEGADPGKSGNHSIAKMGRNPPPKKIARQGTRV